MRLGSNFIEFLMSRIEPDPFLCKFQCLMGISTSYQCLGSIPTCQPEIPKRLQDQQIVGGNAIAKGEKFPRFEIIFQLLEIMLMTSPEVKISQLLLVLILLIQPVQILIYMGRLVIRQQLEEAVEEGIDLAV